MRYRPIEEGTPGLKEVLLSVKRDKFDIVPQVGEMDAFNEVVMMGALYYDPLNPKLTSSMRMNYRRSRSFTRLGEETIRLRHRGDKVDAELYLDSYNSVQKKPYIAERGAVLPKVLPGEQYDRMSWLYLYEGIEVPPASNLVWDGRRDGVIKIISQDNEVADIEILENGDKLTDVREETKNKIESPTLSPSAVISLGGFSFTAKFPKVDIYKDDYDRKLSNFLLDNYSGTGIDGYDPCPSEYIQVGEEKYGLLGRDTVAVLDKETGRYFEKWIKVRA